MQPELFVLPVSPETQARLDRRELAGAFESMVDVQTHLRKLSARYSHIQAMGRELVAALDTEERQARSKAA